MSFNKIGLDPGKAPICSEKKSLIVRRATQIFTNGSAVIEDNKNQVVVPYKCLDLNERSGMVAICETKNQEQQLATLVLTIFESLLKYFCIFACKIIWYLLVQKLFKHQLIQFTIEFYNNNMVFKPKIFGLIIVK